MRCLEQLVVKAENYTGGFPCIIKPVRGRGSQGVSKCDTPEQMHFDLSKAIESRKYGNKMIAEEFLCGNEITVAVFPNAVSLPVVERFSHAGGIAPYSGDVPVSQNSRVAACEDENMTAIRRECEKAVKILDLKGLVRIDCRADKSGRYKIFDFNIKPNMTGSVRPHRKNQSSLVAIAAESVGMSYYGLLLKMIDCKWKM
ncbi:MAG: ATP-grasp domain-containing protein [Oscillospiraceae bacterium]|nr:ATP-grasp domain-containing protein [Oscillospiraceae bacterium]